MSSGVSSIWCERQTASFTKAFKKRYVTFEEESRRLSYGEDEQKPPKDTIILTKVVRSCQVMEVKASELLTLMIDGNHEDGRADQWTLRFASRGDFEQWNELLWRTCASAGLMEPFNYGIPEVHPQTQLPFVQVPLEYLFKFAALDKALLHFFSPVAHLLPPSRDGHTVTVEHFLVVGDRAVYVFKQDLSIVNCVTFSHIRKIHHGPDATFFAIQVRSRAPDIVVRDFAGGVQLAAVLSRAYEVAVNKPLNIVPINVPTVEVLVESQKLRLTPSEGYKLQPVPPTSKTHFLQSLEASRGESNNDASGLGGAGAADLSANGGNSTDPLAKILQSIGLPEYTEKLRAMHVDLDVLKCMDAADLMIFGVEDEKHCKLILDAALSSDMGDLSVDVPGAKTAGVVLGANSGGGGGDIALDDDDDLDLMGVAPPKLSMPVDLDDSDDDILLPKSTEKKISIDLDDDDI